MDVLVPGPRDVRGILDDPSTVDPPTTTRAVAACPPHPQHGGNRGDARLRAVADALGDRSIACLRFDYGDWDEGYAERTDAERAVGWLRDRYESVGLFGYSFGGAIAVLAAAGLDPQADAVAALAPASRIGDDPDRDAVGALERITTPVRIVYGRRDSTVDAEPLADAARERGDEVVAMSADHFFVGQQHKVAARLADFFDARL